MRSAVRGCPGNRFARADRAGIFKIFFKENLKILTFIFLIINVSSGY
jgi:hypothetical protein